MPAQDFANQLVVEIAGAQLPADVASHLLQATVDDSRAVPDLFALRFRDPDHAVLKKTGVKIGAPVKLTVASTEEQVPVPLMVGEVTALEKEYDGTGTVTVIRGLDATHRLTRGRRTASYLQMTVSDVVTRIAADAQLKTGEIEPTGTVHRQLSQGNVTDWEFLRGLVADVGAELAVVDGELRFRRPTRAGTAPSTSRKATEDPLVLELGRNLLRMRATVTSAEQVPDVQVRAWDPTAKRAVIGRAQARTTSAEVGAEPAELARSFGARSLVVTDTPYLVQGEVDDAAAALAEQVAGGFAELEAVVRGNPKVRAGGAVALVGIGEPFDGKYTVTATRHVFEPETGYQTWVTVSGAQDRTLRGLIHGGAGPGAGAPGVVIGQVSDNRDPEGIGRVRLTFPWLSDEFVSDWARTVQAGAGAGRGTLVVPEVGDEVLVAFEQGSFQRPYVLGGLYNGVDKPAEPGTPLVDASSGAVDSRSFVSRTGHRLEFVEAAAGPQGVRVRTGDDKVSVELDQQGTTVTVHSDGTVTVEGARGVTVDAGTGSLKLTGNDITLSARTGVKVDGGGGEVRVSSTSGVAVRGATVKVDGTASTEITGGASCSLRAAMVRIN
jgi:phage protein D